MPLVLPFTLVNGTTADANQVMADLNAIVNYCNNNLQPLIGIPITIANGGTDAITAPGALANLGALGAANNLSDVADPSLAIINLGALAAGNNLSDVASASASLTNLGGLAKANNLSDVASKTTSLNNLLPDQSGHAGATLTTDGTNASWAAASGGPGCAQFRVQQPSGSGSGESLAGAAWTTRSLNTVVFSTIAGATLSGTAMSLPAGTYNVTAHAEAQATGSVSTFDHKLRLRNTSDSVTLVSGLNSAEATGTGDDLLALNTMLQGQFVLTATKTVSLDSFVASAATGGSAPTSTGEVNVYADVFLTKIA